MFHCELLSGIWIGDIDILQNKNFMKDNNISIIFNCTEYFDFPLIDDIQKIRLPFSSMQNSNDLSLLKKNYNQIIDFIHESMDDNNILICCADGKTISPLIVAIYIKKYSKIDNKSIYTILLSKNKNFNLWCDIDLFN
jgi:protein-tyrosine phosphatase